MGIHLSTNVRNNVDKRDKCPQLSMFFRAGKSQPTNGDYYYVLLDNASPSYNINYQNGQVTAK